MDGQSRKTGTNRVEKHKRGGIKMSITSRIMTVLAVAGLFVAGAVGVGAQTTWTGNAGDNSWHTEGNWDNGLPGVGNMPAISTAGDIVDLTEEVTLGTANEAFHVRAQTGSGAPATLNIAADMDLSGSAFLEVGGAFQNDPSGYYRGVVNHTAGTVDAHFVRVGLRGGDATEPSEYNLHGGTVKVATTFTIGETGGTGNFNMHAGEVDVSDSFRVGYLGGVGTFNMHGGDLDANRIYIGDEGGVGTLNVNAGNLSVTEFTQLLDGVLVLHGRADFSIGTTFTIGYGAGNEGVLRTVIGDSGFTPISIGTNLILERDGGESTLEVALDGGVLLSGSSSHTLLTYDGHHATVGTGEWTNLPESLWSTTPTASEVTVTLDTDYKRSTDKLDASNVGNSLQDVNSSIGYIELENVDTEKMLQLRLGMVESSVGGGEDNNLTVFIEDLLAAGYSPVAFGDFASGDYAVDISLDPELNGAAYFAWDLSEYTSSPALEIESIMVIPEPSSIAILVLGLAAVIRLRLRGRRNF